MNAENQKRPVYCLYRGPGREPLRATDTTKLVQLAKISEGLGPEDNSTSWSILESLVERPKTIPELADESAMAPDKIRDALYALEDRALVTHTVPVQQPDGTVEALWLVR